MVTEMSSNLEEALSAFLDGELDAAESDRVVDALKRDGSLQGRWVRYHLIGQAMKRDLPADLRHHLAARVSAAMATEPTVLAPHRSSRKPRPVWRHVASFAVAASITAVAILGVQRMSSVETPTPDLAQHSPTEQQWIRPAGTRWSEARPAVENRLNTYLVNHNEFAGAGSMRGMLPYARIAGYDAGTAASEQPSE